MNMKAYVVFTHYSYDTCEGYWDSNKEIDSIWSDPYSAKERVNILANEYIEKLWYEDGYIPGEDYKEEWNNDKTKVLFDMDGYSHNLFYIEEYKLREGWNEDHKDLPHILQLRI